MAFCIIHYDISYSVGGDSGRVVIWNMEPVIDETAELDSNVPKMLCQLDNHLGINLMRSMFIRDLSVYQSRKWGYIFQHASIV